MTNQLTAHHSNALVSCLVLILKPCQLHALVANQISIFIVEIRCIFPACHATISAYCSYNLLDGKILLSTRNDDKKCDEYAKLNEDARVEIVGHLFRDIDSELVYRLFHIVDNPPPCHAVCILAVRAS